MGQYLWFAMLMFATQTNDVAALKREFSTYIYNSLFYLLLMPLICVRRPFQRFIVFIIFAVFYESVAFNRRIDAWDVSRVSEMSFSELCA